MLIQVCKQLHNENKARETKGLLEAMEFFEMQTGLIVTLDQKDVLDFEGKKIKLIPAYQFLTE